jgi:outer membrane translocation and assembly module TamA
MKIGAAMYRLCVWIFVASSFLFLSCPTGLSQSEYQSQGERKVLVDSLVISGTRAVGSAELAEITNSMSGSTFSDDADELVERIRSQFQNHGYFQVEVQKLDIKVIDPLASPKPVRLEAQVSEGPLFRLSGIDFTGNHAFSSQEMRAKFPIKTGDVFTKSKIAGGLESLRSLLGSRGFLDLTMIPDTTLDSAGTVKLDIEVQEGPQYRMDKLEVAGPPEVAARLQTRWELEPGATFDATYVKTFLDNNSSLLPADFTQSNGIALLKNCSDATVSVHLHLTRDAQHEAADRTKPVDCPSPAEKEKRSD